MLPRTQEEGMQILSRMVGDLVDELAVLTPNLDAAVVFWNRGEHDNPLSVSIFSAAAAQPEAPIAAVTAAYATTCAARGLGPDEDPVFRAAYEAFLGLLRGDGLEAIG